MVRPRRQHEVRDALVAVAVKTRIARGHRVGVVTPGGCAAGVSFALVAIAAQRFRANACARQRAVGEGNAIDI